MAGKGKSSAMHFSNAVAPASENTSIGAEGIDTGNKHILMIGGGQPSTSDTSGIASGSGAVESAPSTALGNPPGLDPTQPRLSIGKLSMDLKVTKTTDRKEVQIEVVNSLAKDLQELKTNLTSPTCVTELVK